MWEERGPLAAMCPPETRKLASAAHVTALASHLPGADRENPLESDGSTERLASGRGPLTKALGKPAQKSTPQRTQQYALLNNRTSFQRDWEGLTLSSPHSWPAG